ncbi:hypothetical protein COO60DRAFT_1036137 [Scenedesmus sp. NREL 46B-D3]|nr:hypothetical protein COO60DRAFT_1036137 [Scenedesmus sp. NREL 46B-D3]
MPHQHSHGAQHQLCGPHSLGEHWPTAAKDHLKAFPRSHNNSTGGAPVQFRRPQVACQAKAAAAVDGAGSKEAHKIFDEAFITVKSGDGGAGEIVEAGRGKYVKNNKYHPGSNQPKQIWLPASDPADGADGADVCVVCDPSLDSLLHLHRRKSWLAPKGAQGNPAMGSSGPKRNAKLKKAMTPPMEIPCHRARS